MARATAPASAPGRYRRHGKALSHGHASGVWSVTARTIMVVRFQWAGRPSASLLPIWRWGSSPSSAIKNTPPSKNPPPTGSKIPLPSASAMSMAGISSDHTAAAIIPPAAKPKNTFWVVCDISFLKQNTIAAPRTVARQVKPVPKAA